MKRLIGIYGLLCAAFCLIGGLVLPQSASAVTINPGGTAILDFPAISPSFSSIDILFTYGSDSFASGESFSLQLFDSSNGAILSAPIIVADGASSTGLILESVSPFYARVTGINGSFDLLSSSAQAYDLNGQPVAYVEDTIETTPLPASLPLFLSGAGLMYGLLRGSKRKGASVQPA